MNTLEVYQEFESIVSEGTTIKHSGQDLVTVTSVRDYYDADENACEEHWCNFKDDYFPDFDVSIEDILEDKVQWEYYYEENCIQSFINGQFDQFDTQVSEMSTVLDKAEDFIDYLQSNYEGQVSKDILIYLAIDYVNSL